MNFSSPALGLQLGENYNSQKARRERNAQLPGRVCCWPSVPAPSAPSKGCMGFQPAATPRVAGSRVVGPRATAASAKAGIREGRWRRSWRRGLRSDVTSAGRDAGCPAQIERSGPLSSAVCRLCVLRRVRLGCSGPSESEALGTGLRAPTWLPSSERVEPLLESERRGLCRGFGWVPNVLRGVDLHVPRVPVLGFRVFHEGKEKI